jgi:hypothetical protein
MDLKDVIAVSSFPEIPVLKPQDQSPELCLL